MKVVYRDHVELSALVVHQGALPDAAWKSLLLFLCEYTPDVLVIAGKDWAAARGRSVHTPNGEKQVCSNAEAVRRALGVLND